jgi:hypothetical protein
MALQLRVQRKNILDSELVKALAGYIEIEGIEDNMIHRLSRHEHEEPIPEKYVQTILDKMNMDFRSIQMTLLTNIDIWLAAQANIPKKKFLQKADDPKPPVLSEKQVEDLRQLIEAHFRTSIGLQVNIPKTWSKIGLQLPDDNIESWIQKAYVAGRLSEVLINGSSYADMLKMAKKLPLSRVDMLTIQAAKQNAAKYIKGYGRKLADIAEDVLVNQHKSALQSIIQDYFTGDLTHTTYNDAGFSPSEVDRLLSTDKEVKGWRELSTELKNRFKASDVGRDWDRISVSEVRYATNLGRIMNIQVEGGGDPEDIEVYYHVQATACKYCKKMYLEPDGSPKIFKLAEILKNVQETGGMQIGLRAGLIGEAGGWVPNTLCHPFGHCYPVRVIKGYKPIPSFGG